MLVACVEKSRGKHRGRRGQQRGTDLRLEALLVKNYGLPSGLCTPSPLFGGIPGT